MVQTVLALALTDDLDYAVNSIIPAFKLQTGVKIKPDWQYTCSNKANAVTADVRDFDRCIDIADLYIILFKDIGNLQIHLHRDPDISSLFFHTNLTICHAFSMAFFASAQNFHKDLVDHSRICLTLHCLHGLSYQEADGFLLTAIIILYRLWIVCDNLLDHFTKGTVIGYGL